MPALLLAGQRDRTAPPALMERMAARMPRAQCLVLPGAGHLVNLEQPGLFNRALARFLGHAGNAV
jgi:3-oxoadipate enol-lactonase